MSVGFNCYLLPIQAELKANWKPATAMVGVAILVTTVWGKTAVVGVGLIGFGSYLTFGPSMKVMTYLDMKGILMVTVLVGNGYFGLVNPMLLNYYAAACMAVREWNFWRIHSELTSHNSTLESHNTKMKHVHDELEKTIGKMEQALQDLCGKTNAAVSIKQQLDERSAEVAAPINRDAQEIQSRLDRLMVLAKSVIENTQKNGDLSSQAEKELSELKNEHQEMTARYNANIEELGKLNQQFQNLLTIQKEQGLQENRQLVHLTDMIDRLPNLGNRICRQEVW